MRYEKTENLLKLALMMQSSAEGVGLHDIERSFGIQRRTAERMRDALLEVFPQIEEFRQEDRSKRWRMPPSTLNGLIHVSAEELVEMKTATEILKKENLMEYANNMEMLWLKIKNQIDPKAVYRIEPDLEALLQAEGYAMRPGPRASIDSKVLKILGNAIKGCSKVNITYRSRGKGEITSRAVCPYGFIYGLRHYLVAWCEKDAGIRTFSLSNIQTCSLLNDIFEKESTFDLKEYTQRSFGIFQEEPYDVVWRFSPKVADDVKEHFFHDTQVIEEQDDGSVLVRFKAGGRKEMCWYIMTWEGEAEILEPDHLRDTYKEMLAALNNAVET